MADVEPRLVIVAGNRTRRAQRAIESASARLALPLRFTVASTPRAVEMAVAHAAESGEQSVLVAGNDFDLSLAAGALLRDGMAGRVAIGIIPLGRPNDFAAALGVGSVRGALAAIAAGEPVAIDAARAVSREGNESHFITSAYAGWAPPVVRSGRRWFARIASRGWNAAAVAARAPLATGRLFTLTIDGAHYDGRYAGVSIHNVERWRAGLVGASGASPGDGLLDVVRWPAQGRIAALRSLPPPWSERRPVHDSASRRPGRTIEFSSPVPTRLMVDGRPTGYLPATVEVLHGALRFYSSPRKEPARNVP